MLNPQISFDDPRKFPPLLRLSDGVRRPDIRRVMGRAIAGSIRRHFSKLDSERPNKLGGKRTHFYGAARRSVQQPELDGGDGVKVAITHRGVAQRYYGGVIEAAPGKALTIPVHPQAHGKRAREFSDLELIPSHRRPGLALLARPNPNSPNGIAEVFYVLVKRIVQREDPTVLPPPDESLRTVLDAGESQMRTLIARDRK